MCKLHRLSKSLFIVLALCCTLSTIVYAADDYNGDHAGKTGTQGHDVGQDWGWSKTGYRFSFVDSEGNTVSNTVDIVLDTSNFTENMEIHNLNKRGECLGHKVIPKSDLPSYLQQDLDYPMQYKSGVFLGKGDKFKAWANKVVKDDSGMELQRIVHLMNAKDSSGNYYFNIPGQEGEPAVIFRDNAYQIHIEVIGWFTPITGAGKRYDKKVYGTITEHAQWSIDKKADGTFDDQNKIMYRAQFQGCAPWSLFLEHDEYYVTNPTTICHPEINFSVNAVISDIGNIADKSQGFALHIYKSDNQPKSTHTWNNHDHPDGLPSEAPNLKEDPLTKSLNIPDESLIYRIVKVYQNKAEDGTIVHYKTFTRYPTISKIKIEDEPQYKVKEWKYSKDYDEAITSITKWEDPEIANVSIVEKNEPDNLVTTVDISNKDNKLEPRTLYVCIN